MPRNGIARLNADGSLDTNFNSGTGASDSSIDSMAIAPDGKILIGGVFTSFNGTPRQRVARLNGDGKTDIALRRADTNGRVWYVMTDFGVTFTATEFGSTSAQTAVGDYNGDGKTDIAVYQNDANGGGFNFFVQKSSDGKVSAYRWGQNLDSPIAAFNQF